MQDILYPQGFIDVAGILYGFFNDTKIKELRRFLEGSEFSTEAYLKQKQQDKELEK